MSMLQVLLLCLLSLCSEIDISMAATYTSIARTAFIVKRLKRTRKSRKLLVSKIVSGNSLALLLRGGTSSVVADDEDGEGNSLKNGNQNDKESVEEGNGQQDDVTFDDQDPNDGSSPSISQLPVKLIFTTNLENPVVDFKTELTQVRTRTVAEVKKNLSRKLPDKPPLPTLEIIYGGRVLPDDMIVDELFEDEDEEESEDDGSDDKERKLVLNIIPPVDPKFGTDLSKKLLSSDELEGTTLDHRDLLSTDEMLDAYFLNQLIMAQNAQLLADPNTKVSATLQVEMKDNAKLLKQEFSDQIPTDVWVKSMQKIEIDSSNKEEWRGQRYRGGKGGVTTHFKKAIQTNFNVNWFDAIRILLLFLFFGYFGGRDSFSRTLLIWGGPVSILLQARPFKIWIKTLFYMMMNPPLIVQSLMPAPQQAILSTNTDRSYFVLYGINNTLAEDGSSIEQGLSSDNEEDDLDEQDSDEYDDEYETEDDDNDGEEE